MSNLASENSNEIENKNPGHSQKQSGRWTKDQHRLFLEGLELYGKNWKKIETLVKTRNGSQIRSHAQKHFNKVAGKEGKEEALADFKQLSTHSDYNISKSYSRIDCPVGLPSVHFCFSDKGPFGHGMGDLHCDETSMDYGLFSRPIEEISVAHSNPKSAHFIEILQDSKKNKDQSFMKMYVDVQSKSCLTKEKTQPYTKKTSFVKFAREVEQRQPQNQQN